MKIGKKALVLSLVVLVLGATAAYGAAGASKTRYSGQPIGGRVTDGPSVGDRLASNGVKLQGLGDVTGAQRVRNCGAAVTAATLRCLNTQIKFMDTRLNKTVEILATLVNCFGVLPETQYYGYWYTADGI